MGNAERKKGLPNKRGPASKEPVGRKHKTALSTWIPKRERQDFAKRSLAQGKSPSQQLAEMVHRFLARRG